MKNKKEEKKEELTPDASLLARLFDEENDENIFLFDADGKEIEMEQIAVIAHDDKIYAILHPVGEAEDEAVVFEINPEDEESLSVVEDDVLGNKILDIYHEKAGL
jgi:uncharacterized protein YrzB (UPF0473 family)